MLKWIVRIKLRNNLEEAPFGIPVVSTENENIFSVNPIVESNIGFMLEIDWYSFD